VRKDERIWKRVKQYVEIAERETFEVSRVAGDQLASSLGVLPGRRVASVLIVGKWLEERALFGVCYRLGSNRWWD